MAVTRNTRIMGQRLGLSFAGKDYWSDMSKYELADGRHPQHPHHGPAPGTFLRRKGLLV
nr:MAG TPA: hypothetical protein [Caudoviricetes sp.]